MSITEKLFALKEVPGFDRLYESELITIAAITGVRQYRPGEVFCRPGRVLRRLYVVIRGRLEIENGPAIAPIVGVGSILYGIPVDSSLQASKQTGALCLMITRPHFFTIAYQCPALITGLLDMKLVEALPGRAREGKP